MNAFDYLNKNYLLNVPIIEAIERGEAVLESAFEWGVAANHKDGMLLLSLDKAEYLEYFKDKINAGVLTVFYGMKENDDISKINPLVSKTVPCYQFVYTKKQPPPVEYKADYRLLDEDFTDIVFKNYSRARDSEYIKKLLRRKWIYGAFLGKELVGFVGRHSDGSMGLLEVLPKYRRMGLGRDLEHFIIGVVLDEKKTPYAHIVLGNEVSMCLQNSVEGVEQANRLVTWFRADV